MFRLFGPAILLFATAWTAPAQSTFFTDVPPGSPFFTFIQIAKNLGLANAESSITGGCNTTGNPPLIAPPPSGGTTHQVTVNTTAGSATLDVPAGQLPASVIFTGGTAQGPGIPVGATVVGVSATTVTLSETATLSGSGVTVTLQATGVGLVCHQFGPNTLVTRAEMAYWVVRGQMDEAQVGLYLCATGGDPTGVSCPGGTSANSFVDTTSGLPPVPGVSAAQLTRYIEVMYRRGYTKGCAVTSDARRRYCPADLLTRGQMAVFLMRAKMNNVFPTSLSGIPISNSFGDNFGVFLPVSVFFTDVDPNHEFAPYISKMRELGITTGTTATTFSPNDPLTRAQIATFIVRAFFL